MPAAKPPQPMSGLLNCGQPPIGGNAQLIPKRGGTQSRFSANCRLMAAFTNPFITVFACRSIRLSAYPPLLGPNQVERINQKQDDDPETNPNDVTENAVLRLGLRVRFPISPAKTVRCCNRPVNPRWQEQHDCPSSFFSQAPRALSKATPTPAELSNANCLVCTASLYARRDGQAKKNY